MDSTAVTLQLPGLFDTSALSISTRRSLDLISSIRKHNLHDSNLPQEVVDQVLKYAQAISLGVEAAELGFTVADDLASLSEIIPDPSGNDVEIRLFLLGELTIATQSRFKAEETISLLRDVEISLEFITERDRRGKQGVEVEAESAGREALVEFRQQISNLVEWWSWMDIHPNANNPLVKRELTQDELKEMISSIDYSSLWDPAVIQAWRRAKFNYANYKQTVSQLRVLYPDIFVIESDVLAKVNSTWHTQASESPLILPLSGDDNDGSHSVTRVNEGALSRLRHRLRLQQGPSRFTLGIDCRKQGRSSQMDMNVKERALLSRTRKLFVKVRALILKAFTNIGRNYR